MKTHIILTNSGAPIALPEVGRTIGRGEELDLCFPGSPYEFDPDAALRALNDLSGTVLYQQSHGTAPALSYRVAELEE